MIGNLITAFTLLLYPLGILLLVCPELVTYNGDDAEFWAFIAIMALFWMLYPFFIVFGYVCDFLTTQFKKYNYKT